MKIKTKYLLIVLAIFYVVGILGILYPETRGMVLPLSAYHLLLTFVMVFLARSKNNLSFLLFALICSLYGVAVELIGVHTGWLFGSYHYGGNLGLKVAGVPLIIGINWTLMVATSQAVAARIFKQPIAMTILAAALMTGLDFLIEPVAMKVDFWNWKAGIIPIYNYICWFFVSLPMHYLYRTWNLKQANQMDLVVFLYMVGFFALLNLFL